MRDDAHRVNPPLEVLDAFIATLHAVRCDFSLQPTKEHIATCINYADLLEMRTEFVRELSNTTTAFVYSGAKQRQLVEALKREGRSDGAAWSQLLKKAHQKFRRSSLRGQFCELLLCNLLQYYFKAAPLLRKMRLTTNPGHERYGADAIHVAAVDGRHVLYIGEAKSYDRERSALKLGLVDAIRDAHGHYRDHRNELNLYTFEDFLAPELEALACGYLAGTTQLEVQLVCIVTYDDKGVASGANRDELLQSTIDRALQEAASMSSHPVFKEVPANLISRLTTLFSRLGRWSASSIRLRNGLLMVEPIDSGDVLIKRLLRYDLEVLAAKLRHSAGVDAQRDATPLTDGEAAALLNLAERYSRQDADGARMRSLLICGLIWEHRREAWKALPGFVMNLLSRMGLDPALPMVDHEYVKEVGRLASVGDSHIEASIAARALLHEVAVGGDSMVLSEFQLRVWRGIDQHLRLGISAPTSAGKSHVLAYKVVELLERAPGEAVFIVPTLSLIKQVTRDLRIAADKWGLRDLVILQTVPEAGVRHGRLAYVLTQERAQSALRDPSALRGLKLLVIDEIQNIERVAKVDDDRSRALYDVIQEFEVDRAPERIVISGPRVGNMRELVRELFGATGESITAELPPVVNITYSFGEKAGRIVLCQHTPIPELSQETDFGEYFDYPGAAFGSLRYTSAVDEAILATARTVMGDGGVLVFSPTSRQAERTALHLARGLTGERSSTAASLAQYAADTVHPSYALKETAESGVLYHHGHVPPHIRGAVEIAFARQVAPVLVCTTTLIQGVNLPAKTIIALNPRLYTRVTEFSTDLTTYEFANLRGRAGRLLKDFVGRSIALDQSSFKLLNVEFSFPETQLRSGLGDRFHVGREDVGGALRASASPRREVSVSDIVVYIRQSVLRFREQARARLLRVGIDLSDAEYDATRASLASLTVPVDICLACPYWDPFELDKVFAAVEHGKIGEIPQTPFEVEFVERMVSIVQAMEQVTPYYYRKHAGQRHFSLRSLMISAQQWCQERELHQIIAWGRGDQLTTKEIDDRIEQMMRQVAVNLPKLLRPIANIQAMGGRETGVLGMMELGASKELTRKLIELGLPRDVSIRLGRLMDAGRADARDERALREAAVRASKDLRYWDALQVLDILAPGQG